MDKKGRTDEELQKADGEKESEWPSELKIGSGEEFQQSLAVAHLAVRLCELERTNPTVKREDKLKLLPEKFLDDAWKLIEGARACVSRPQTNKEYLAAHCGSDEAMEEVVGRTLQASRIPFHNVCDPDYKNKEHTKIIHRLKWIVYRSERGFDDLFWAYWRETSILKLRTIMSASEVLGNEPDKWESYGKQVLASWKRDGIPPNEFLALPKFRREHDKRALNLKKKPKGKVKRAAANGRSVQQKHRAH